MPREDGYFKKGNKGKPKGSKHRTSQEIRDFIQQVVDKNLNNLEEDLARMSPTMRWMVIEKMTKFFLPTLSKNDNINHNEGGIKIMVEYQDTTPQLDAPNTPINLANPTAQIMEIPPDQPDL